MNTRRDYPTAFLGSGVKVLRRVFGGLKNGVLTISAGFVSFILDPRKRQFSLAFYLTLVMLVVFTEFFSTLSVAASQTSVSKTTSADWDLGTNAGVTTTGDEVKLTGRSGSWYNSSAPTFYDSAYSYRRKITFDNSAQAENLTDFPVMLKLDNASLAWNAKIQADMDDVIFKDADGTQLKWEWEKKDAAGESIAWVKVPQIDASSSSDFIYMDYGNVSATDQSDAANVWTNNYGASFHLKESSGNISDSTSYSITGTAGGTPGYSASGKIGSAISFSGDDYFNFGTPASMNTANCTVGFWGKSNDIPVATERTFDENKTNSGSLTFYLNTTPRGFFQYRLDGSEATIRDVAADVGFDYTQWHYFSLTYNGTQGLMYVDGNLQTDTDATAGSLDMDSFTGARIGSSTGSSQYYDGALDEVRYSSTARSDKWIAAEYKNQGTNNFTSVGAEGTLDGFSYRRTITFDNSAQAENLANFPVMIKATNDELNWSSLVQADLDDVIFVDSDNTTLLNWEWEKKDRTSESIAWVKVPQIDASSSSDYVYMYYANASAGDQSVVSSTWESNYHAAWHLNEASGVLYDSTSNDIDLTPTVNNPLYGQACVINGCLSWSGADIRVTKASDIPASNRYTVEAWVKPGTQVSTYGYIANHASTDGNLSYALLVQGSDLRPMAGHSNSGGSGVFVTGTNPLPTTSWTHLAATYDGANVKLYVNGVYDNQVALPTMYTANPGRVDVGGYVSTRYVGLIDEPVVSYVARSDKWIAAEYKNQGTNTFTTFGAPQNSDSYSYRRKITFDNSAQAENLVNFPVVVKANNSSLAWSSLIQADMDDVIFVDADDSTPLSFEWETKAPAGDSIAWVKVPQINSSSSSDYIYMYYSNATTIDHSHQRGVWDSSSIEVQHMEESSGTFTDSSGHYNGTGLGMVYAQTGKIGNAAEWNGSTGSINYGDITQLNSTTAFTISFWMSQDVLDQADNLFTKAIDSNNAIRIETGADGYLGVAIRTPTNYAGSQFDYSTVVSAGSYFLISVVYDGTQSTNDTRLKMYINGVQRTLGFYGTIPSATANLAGYNATNPTTYDGKLDEFKISSNARSANWVAAEYKNQTDTFNYVGTQEGKNYPITVDGAWYAGAGGTWSYRQKITVDHTKVASDLTDFPMLVKITDGANPVFDNAQGDADDILFTSSGGTTKLSHEIEKFTTSSGTRELDTWVKTNFSSSTDTVLYMYYGNAGATSQQDVANVWTNGYGGVWHLKEASGNVNDSTNNANHAVATGTPGYGATGKMNGAVDFETTENDGFTRADSASLRPTEVSVSAWIKIESTEGWLRIAEKAYSAGFAGWSFVRADGDHLVDFVYTDAAGTQYYSQSTTVPATATWFHVYATCNGSSSPTIYVNGASVGETGQTYGYSSASKQLGIGARHDGAWAWFDGLIDELHVSSGVRSAQWISTEYNNQNSPSTFFSLASEAKAASYFSPTGTGDGSGIINTLWNGGWGTPNGFSSNVTVPANTSISYQIRSSAVGGSNDGDWTSWASLGTATTTGLYSVANASMPAITLGANKYLQIRSYLTTSDGQSTPVMADYTIYYLADVDAPSNPTTTALTVGGAAQTTGSWTNDTGAVSTSFSGAIDAESGVAGYYLYFGTNASADPSTYQAHVGALGDTQTWATGTTLSSADDGKTFYLRAKTKDNSNNTSSASTLFTISYDSTNPARPISITVDPAGYTSTNSFDFTWPVAGDPIGPGGGASGIAYYQYKRSSDVGWTNTTGPADRVANDLTAYQEGTNIFYVRSVDNAGNTSSNNTQVTYYWSGQAPPKPDNLNVDPTSAAENSFTISWDKPAQGPGDSPIVGYYYSINTPPTALNTTYVASTAAHVSIGPDHYATQQGENTVYVVSRNEAGNNSFLPEYYATDTFNCQTTAPPIPTSVSIYDSSDKALQRFSLSLNWIAGASQNPTTFGHYLIERSTNGTDYFTLATTLNTSYIDAGLSDAVTYYYRLKAVDSANSTSAASTVVSAKPSGKYTQPPTISSTPSASANSTRAVITWTTDRASTSFVKYSEDQGSLSESKGSEELTSAHEVTISGLKSATRYYYKVQSFDQQRDYALESALSDTYSFITLDSPSISKVEAKNLTLYSADITWDTTTVATSRIDYGSTSSYGKTVEDISGVQTTNHSAKIASLEHSTQYHFKITGTDVDGNLLESDDYSFETLAMPKIRSLKIEAVQDAASQTAKITWQTNVKTSSMVSYSSQDEKPKEEVKSALEESHEIIISNLADNQTYKVTVSGKDEYGNLAQAEGQTYTTKEDTRAPKIMDIIIESSSIGLSGEDKAQAVVYFKTDEPAAAKVEYGEGMSGDFTRQTALDESYKTDHLIIISDLKPLMSYHFRITVQDKAQNKTVSPTEVKTTSDAPKSVLNIILQVLQRLFGWIKL